MNINIYTLVWILGLVFAVLYIMLFIKHWRMTNNIDGMHKLMFLKEAIERKPNDELKKTLDETIIKELSRQ